MISRKKKSSSATFSEMKQKNIYPLQKHITIQSALHFGEIKNLLDS